ncbi:MAG TPA: NAD(P)/FAD-dependent oxidoreductase [Candidatus Saccharimonadales bacterium]|nr:NAD(P)/FAD-dependent oxidoreductase [Candidatus Saccharimonadales bacterium]
MVDFEVIVVGAGPAGAMLTKELAKRKFSVLCIEKEIEVGLPNKSTAGTPLDTFEIFDLPLELGYSEISGLRIYGPTESWVQEYDKPYARLFKFRELKQYLIREAITYGAQTMLATEVTGPIMEKGKIIGVKYKGFEGTGEVRANVVVDATGPESILAAELGLMPKYETKADANSLEYFFEPGVGGAYEYFMANAKPDRGDNGFFLDLFMGSELAPGGYSWIFPTSETEVKAGVCKMDPTFVVKGEKSQKEYFQKLWKENPQIKDAQPFEVHLCPYRHWVIGGLKSATLDNFMAIGDAATKFQPVFGEGVRASFYSAHFAADALENARNQNDYSKKALELQDKLWDEKWGSQWNLSAIIYKVLYHSDDDEIDNFLRGLKKLDFDTLWKLYLGKGGMRDSLKLARHLPDLLGKKTVSKTIRRKLLK